MTPYYNQDGGAMAQPLVEAWIQKFGDLARYYLVTHQTAPSPIHHVNYDGIKCWLDLSGLLAESDPETSEALWAYAQATMGMLWDYSKLSTGPDEKPVGATGYYNYNLGPRMMMDDPRANPDLVHQYGTIAANFARGSAYSSPEYTVYFRTVWEPKDGSWPDVGINYQSPDRKPAGLARPYALALIGHLTMDDIYSNYEHREVYGYTFTEAHDFFIPEFLSRWFLGFDSATGLDRPYWACIDQWRDTSARMEELNGDFSQDSATWDSEWTPFMFAHVCRMLVTAYDHPAITGHLWAVKFQAEIVRAVSDLCEISLRWFQLESPRGRPSLLYRIGTDGTLPEFGAPNLSLFEMPMFAWSARMTGSQRHREFAISLAETGIAEGYWSWGFIFNQGVIWTKDGFYYLFSEDEGMAVDIAALQALLNQLDTENTEAVAAKAQLVVAQTTLSEVQAASEAAVAEVTATTQQNNAEAQEALTEATNAYTTENEEKLAKMQELIAMLQAGMVE